MLLQLKTYAFTFSLFSKDVLVIPSLQFRSFIFPYFITIGCVKIKSIFTYIQPGNTPFQ